MSPPGRCPTEEDSVWGIQWFAIAAGSSQSALCLGDGGTSVNGLAYRRCLAGVTAVWGFVDASECESVAARAVREKVYRAVKCHMSIAYMHVLQVIIEVKTSF